MNRILLLLRCLWLAARRKSSRSAASPFIPRRGQTGFPTDMTRPPLPRGRVMNVWLLEDSFLQHFRQPTLGERVPVSAARHGGSSTVRGKAFGFPDHPEGIGIDTNQFDLLGPKGRHNFCRGRQALERIIQDSRAPKVATQFSLCGVCRRLRGSFMIVLVIRGLTAPAKAVSALRACRKL